ncbi:37S ribosomal protein Rsm22 [Colletotrichum truncatum]|uniref:37S ribosomal protein Rsm22 n=1 Tax=Colletotrichum truncatum TaxID=5467 RepID=A0ACC3YZ34_COLTU|nr:37S ribosomal protein Rsm22 [Colletotrichum truncatum]KAF6786331.1 37S ribosomal protein Rsm22 [Colletotrichum truncatum]
MSIEIWPPVSPEELAVKKKESLRRELEWIVNETQTILKDIRHGLQDCYALLAPIDPGSTLVMSTQRNERVKGTVTRVGTRIVKGAIHLQLKTLPTQTVTIDASHPIHIAALETIHTHLTECIDLLSLTSTTPTQNASQLAAQLRILSASLGESSSLLKGPPLNEADPRWQTDSCPPVHFSPPLGPNVSIHLGLQESSLVLWLRALEPVDAPQHFGTKLGLALGTVRRLEHDEMDRPFRFSYSTITDGGEKHKHGRAHPTSGASSVSGLGTPSSNGEPNEVFVREKVRVESLPDPNLMSLSSKLIALGYTLASARRNLAAVMGEEVDE